MTRRLDPLGDDELEHVETPCWVPCPITGRTILFCIDPDTDEVVETELTDDDDPRDN